MTNIPRMRFPGFSDEWQVKKLGDLATKVGSGATPTGGSSVYRPSGVPFIRSQNITGGKLNMRDVVFIDEETHRTMRNSAIKPNDVLLNITGASLGRTCVVPGDFKEGNLNQHVCIIRLAEANPYIVHTILSKPKGQHDLLKTQTGGGKEGLNFQAVRSFKLALPAQKEQKKIADFLTAVDERIALMEKKLELLKKYKKGVMQKIFTQQIRFKDENGDFYPDWEVRKLSDIFDRITNKNSENNQNVLTISAQQGLVSQTEYFNKIVAAKNVTNYYLLERNDFAYNKSYSVGFPMGAVKRLKYYDKGIVSTLYICFRAKDARDVDFFEHIFDLGLQNREIEKVAQEGARNHGLLNIAVGDFFDIEFKTPLDRSEQQKITYLLNLLSDKINSEDKKLQKAKEFKKSLLQRMFV